MWVHVNHWTAYVVYAFLAASLLVSVAGGIGMVVTLIKSLKKKRDIIKRICSREEIEAKLDKIMANPDSWHDTLADDDTY